MTEPLFVRPIIEAQDFLPIFVSASLILVFGLFYASIITLVKMHILSKKYDILAYLFWGLQVYSTYFMTEKMHSQPFTVKAMVIAMFAYLMVPHIYYYLITKSEERYENTQKED